MSHCFFSVVLVGVELDKILPSGHAGTLDNVQHFTCHQGHGIYVRPEEVVKVLTILDFSIYCKPVDDSFGFARINSRILDRYVFKTNAPILICKNTEAPLTGDGTQRRLHIESLSDISILATVVINANITNDSGRESVIRLMSKGTVRNQGTLRCNATSKDVDNIIYIVADTFVNEGKMECLPSGQIKVYCRYYTNNGIIRPEPEVIREDKFQINCARNLANYPLSVIDYFMHSLLLHREYITTPKAFYRKIGVELVNEWIPSIEEHKLLYSDTSSGDTVCGRLRHELGLHVQPRRDILMSQVSLDDVLSQATVGLEMSGRLKDVVQQFGNLQQSGADKLQDVYTKLPPMYKDLDGMKDFADLFALVHELILETVSAQKRLADFLVKDVVPDMDARLKV